MLTTFSFSGRFGVLAQGFPGNDWEALRSFAFLHDVRHFYLAYISVVYTMSNVVYSNARTLGGPLHPDEPPTTFISTLTVPTEVFTRDARVGDVTCSEIAAGHGPVRTIGFAV